MNFFSEFYLRRAQRILPLYMAFTACALVLQGIGVTPHAVKSFSSFLIFGQNMLPILGAQFDWPVNVTWSLCIEEHFYMIWPLVVLALSQRAIAWTAVGVLGISFALRYGMALEGLPVGMITFTNLYGLAFGALLACGAAPSRPMSALIVVGSIVAVAVFIVLPDNAFYIALLKPALAAFYFVVVHLRARLKLGCSALVYLGRTSYGIYLIHPLVLSTLAHLHLHFAFYAALSVAMTIAIAHLSWRFFEQPILAMRKLQPASLSPIRSGY